MDIVGRNARGPRHAAGPVEEIDGPIPPGDAELIAAVRGGDMAAYGVLYERHSAAAYSLARGLNRDGADDLVAEAFASVLDALRQGRGPDTAFRAYLLTTLRHGLYDNTRRDRRLQFTDDLAPHDPGTPFIDPSVAKLESSMVATAYTSLPERWQTVLWHTEIEGQKPADVAPLLGLTPNGAAALAYRAREGLRQAYLQAHLAEAAEDNCRYTLERLGAHARGGLSKREAARVEQHLNEHDRCRALAAELSDINGGLRAVVAPLVLGGFAAAYIAAQQGGLAAASMAAAAGGGSAAIGTGLGSAGAGTGAGIGAGTGTSAGLSSASTAVGASSATSAGLGSGLSTAGGTQAASAGAAASSAGATGGAGIGAGAAGTSLVAGLAAAAAAAVIAVGAGLWAVNRDSDTTPLAETSSSAPSPSNSAPATSTPATSAPATSAPATSAPVTSAPAAPTPTDLPTNVAPPVPPVQAPQPTEAAPAPTQPSEPSPSAPEPTAPAPEPTPTQPAPTPSTAAPTTSAPPPTTPLTVAVTFSFNGLDLGPSGSLSGNVGPSPQVRVLSSLPAGWTATLTGPCVETTPTSVCTLTGSASAVTVNVGILSGVIALPSIRLGLFADVADTTPVDTL